MSPSKNGHLMHMKHAHEIAVKKIKSVIYPGYQIRGLPVEKKPKKLF